MSVPESTSHERARHRRSMPSVWHAHVAPRTQAVHLLLVFALGLGLSFSGCSGTDAESGRIEKALVQAPLAGDLYAAELTYFSRASFEGQPEVYGLMKVVAIDGDAIMLITENAGSASPQQALLDLGGDLADIEFDEVELIEVPKAALEQAYQAGKIVSARRR